MCQSLTFTILPWSSSRRTKPFHDFITKLIWNWSLWLVVNSYLWDTQPSPSQCFARILVEHAITSWLSKTWKITKNQFKNVMTAIENFSNTNLNEFCSQFDFLNTSKKEGAPALFSSFFRRRIEDVLKMPSRCPQMPSRCLQNVFEMPPDPPQKHVQVVPSCRETPPDRHTIKSHEK